MTEALPSQQPEKLPEQAASPIVEQLRIALDSKEGNLKKVGDLMYKTFKSPEYSPENVLKSLKEVYEANQTKLEPKIQFTSFIKSFGDGLVMLCQHKLLEAGFKLGKYGENKDGVDGKLGPVTSFALNRFFQKKTEKEEKTLPPLEPKKITKLPDLSDKDKTKVSDPKAKVVYEKDYPKPVNPLLEGYLPTPYTPGTETGTKTPLTGLAQQIEDIYSRMPHIYKIDTLTKFFGERKEGRIKPYITDIDPLTNEKISFLGKPLHGGINLMMIPFLKIAEEEIRKSNIKYQPAGKDIGGFHDRDMNSMGGKASNVPSFHAYGLAIDLDASENSPAKGRGNIPDQVVMIMVNAGFSWGGRGDLTQKYDYLGQDPMHFQMRFPPTDPAGQAIINSSPAGIAYWKVIEPMLKKYRRKPQP